MVKSIVHYSLKLCILTRFPTSTVKLEIRSKSFNFVTSGEIRSLKEFRNSLEYPLKSALSPFLLVGLQIIMTMICY